MQVLQVFQLNAKPKLTDVIDALLELQKKYGSDHNFLLMDLDQEYPSKMFAQ